MADEIRLDDSLGLASGVLEQIVTLAAEAVEGVASVGPTGLAGVVKKGGGKSKGVAASMGEDGGIAVAIHIYVTYGQPLRKVARTVQDSVADAVRSQVGQDVSAVDVFVDGVVFPE